MGLKEKIAQKIGDRAVKSTKRAMDNVIQKTQRDIGDQMAVMNESFSRIIENQNEQALALISIYKALEVVAKAQKLELPEPLVEMEVGEEVDV